MLADMSVQISAARELIYKAARSSSPFPDPLFAAQAKIFAADAAIKVTNDALQVFGAAGYLRNRPLERMVRDARMFTIGGGTAQILRTVVASRILGRKIAADAGRVFGGGADGKADEFLASCSCVGWVRRSRNPPISSSNTLLGNANRASQIYTA
jgi:hypothetical protein